MAKTSGGTKERKIGGVTVTPRLATGVVLAVLAVWFILMNTADVKIHLWGLSTVTMPMWVMLAVMLLVGVVLGWFGRRYRDSRR
ncbi:LapA family protein [Streptacidiphilus rugosus]|uniref:LapA family protein n=1 Tax=Streptacidiphilus rugosus TaxID=405783 RepID=UPI00068DFF3E|nr:LapA family protein [Streptacidiphilus rugosus]